MIIFSKIPRQELVDFTKSLAVMLKSGISINEALTTLAEQTESKRFGVIIASVKREIETGVSLSEAFAKRQKSFGKIFISLLKAGEASGTLEENLSFLADWLERENDLRNEISAATLYPKIVLASTLALGGGLAVLVLPRLTPLFKNLHIQLPAPTRILLAVSLFVQEFWLFTFLGVTAAIVIFALLAKAKPVKRTLHSIYIGLPFIGNLLVSYQLALISQLFTTFFKGGLPINDSLDITSQAATNTSYQTSMAEIKKIVTKGNTLSAAMKKYPRLYPKNLISILAAGEKSGTLENSFGYMSDFYAKAVRGKIKKLPTILEPVLLILIGLIVGFVALAIIMPIYQLTRGISR